MKMPLMIAGVAIVAITIPAIAAHHDGAPHDMQAMMMKDMSRAEVQAQVKEHFAMLDTNKDGAVTKDEVKARHEAMRAERRDEHFKQMDANGDGSITRAEFDAAHAMHRDKMTQADDGADPKGGPMMKMWHGRHHGMAMKLGGRLFDRVDVNKDGKVTLAESQTAALGYFDRVDANKDGTVTAAERMDFWKTKKEAWRAKAAPAS